MKNLDIELLWMFTLRIEMYTLKENSDTISSFLHGYEIGRNDECTITALLSSSIHEEYGIPHSADGWVGQIQRAADKLHSDWVTIYKIQSLKLLAKAQNFELKEDLSNSLKRRIKGKASGVHLHFRRAWITDWFGIVNLNSNWFDSLWTTEALEIMTEIEAELHVYGHLNELKENIQPTRNLAVLCERLLPLIKVT